MNINLTLLTIIISSIISVAIFTYILYLFHKLHKYTNYAGAKTMFLCVCIFVVFVILESVFESVNSDVYETVAIITAFGYLIVLLVWVKGFRDFVIDVVSRYRYNKS